VPLPARAQAYWLRALLEQSPAELLAVFSVGRFGGRQLVAVHAGSTAISVATVHIIGIIDIEGFRNFKTQTGCSRCG
jgi:hypothetical protein